jgi:hypothetical protein
MDPHRNPYAPGAGFPPPELAGRDEIIGRAAVTISRIKAGRASRSIILYGLRGVGKTVLLNKFRLDAEARGLPAVVMEAPEDRSLPALLAPALRSTLIRLSRTEALRAGTGAAMRALASFVGAFKLRYQDVEVGIDIEPDKGIADSGDLAADLADLLATVGRAAKERDAALILYVDELQYVAEDQLAALIFALHRVAQDQLPVNMIAAGLPQLLGRMGRAKSYAERLFEFVEIDKLDTASATDALCKPAEREGVAFAADAVTEIFNQTLGYPYFLQEWGKHCWNVAQQPPITKKDAKLATTSALAELDAGFFRVRFDRLTPAEKRYLRAMAELGPGPHRSGDVAEKLGKKVQSVGFMRNNLISKGMVFSASHGDLQFTVPLFEGFMKRIMPELS